MIACDPTPYTSKPQRLYNCFLVIEKTGCNLKEINMIVITDMMGTLTTGSPILGFIDWVRQHQSKAKARWLTTQMMLGYLSAKAGLIDARKWQQNILIDSLDWIQAPSPAKLAEVSEWTVEHNLWPQRREDVIARLQEHVHQGAQVIIASCVFEPVAAAFGSRIGAQAIGTPLT
jgi:phosphoserine phosphatase